MIPWTAAHQLSLYFTISWSLLKLVSTESVMPSNHLILCHPIFLPLSSCPQSFPNIRALPMSWLFALFGQSMELKDVTQLGENKTSVQQSSQACSWEISIPWTVGRSYNSPQVWICEGRTLWCFKSHSWSSSLPHGMARKRLHPRWQCPFKWTWNASWAFQSPWSRV